MHVPRVLRTTVWNDRERRLRTPWRLAIASAVFGVGVFLALFVVGVVASLAGLEVAVFEGVSALATLSAVSVVVVAGGLWLVARFVDRRRVGDYGLRVDDHWWADLAFGLVLGAVLQTGLFLVGWGLGWFRVTGTFAAEGSFLPTMVGLAALFLAVGIYEELLARGWLLTNLVEGFRFVGERLAVGVAVFLSSALFGLVHLPNPGATLLSASIITLAGIFLALGYLLTGELGIPIGVHITWNFFQGPVFGLGVSGLEMPASLLAVEATGPELVTGGAFGPEAGVLGIVTILLGSAATCWWAWHRAGTLAVHPRVTTPALRD